MRTLSTDELKQMRDNGEPIELINVLPEESYRKAHIAGSSNVPLEGKDFPEKVKRMVGDTERTVVVYCGSEACDMSPKAARSLEQAGFRNVYDYEGGVKAWQEAGLPMEQGQP